MAYLYQASASPSDTDKLTISAWVKVLTTNAPSESGDTYSLFAFGKNFIGLVTNSTISGAARIWTGLYGEPDSIDGLDICTTTDTENGASDWSYTRLGATPSIGGGGNPWLDITNSGSGGNKYSPSLETVTLDNIDAKVTPGKWFHLMVAIDTSAELAFWHISALHKVSISINGVACKKLRGPFNGVSSPIYTDGSVPSVLSRTLEPTPYFNCGPFIASSESTGASTSGLVPGYNFFLNGSEIGLPSFPDSTLGLDTQNVLMADVQVWVGTYIDPFNASNFSKLVNVDENGHGTPVNTDVAADYFGPQTYLFKGARDGFLINQGTGGAFSNTGTIESATFGGW